MTKDINWQQKTSKPIPAIWAMRAVGVLAGVTIWNLVSSSFSSPPIGIALILGGVISSYLVLVFARQGLAGLTIPLLMALAGIGVLVVNGNLLSGATPVILWPLLAAAAIGGGFSSGLVSSLCLTLVMLALLGLYPAGLHQGGSAVTGFSTLILANGTCGALALAASYRVSSVVESMRQAARSKTQAAEAARDQAFVAREAAKSETQARAQFMAEMSHEIRTPLNAILGFADTMREGVFGPLPTPYADYPSLIHKSGSHLLDLVSDLLDISKIEAGRYETKLQPLGMDQFIYEAIRLSSGSAKAAGVHLRQEAGPSVKVLGDERALRQIAFNLISNAIKFTPSGGRITIRAPIDSKAGVAGLEIEDDGVGISEADLRRIGEPWTQASNQEQADSRKSRGTGLGLTLVKRLTELQNGTFTLTSTLGKGTTVRVMLLIADMPIADIEA